MIRTILMASTVLALPLAACAQNDMAEPSTASSTTTSAPASDAMATGSTDAMATGSADAMATTNSGMASDGSMATGASATTSLTPGATVYDTAGGVVGTVSAINGANVVLNTGSNTVSIASTSFGTGEKGPTLATTKAQLDAQAMQSQAQSSASLDSMLTAGATVNGLGGTSVGTIKSVEGEFVTVTTTKGDVRLPKTGFAVRDNGLTIGMTAEQLAAAIPAG